MFTVFFNVGTVSSLYNVIPILYLVCLSRPHLAFCDSFFFILHSVNIHPMLTTTRAITSRHRNTPRIVECSFVVLACSPNFVASLVIGIDELEEENMLFCVCLPSALNVQLGESVTVLVTGLYLMTGVCVIAVVIVTV